MKALRPALLLLLCWTFSPVLWAAPELRASVDRQQIAEDETLLLVISFDAQVATGEPDLRHLSEDFEIIGKTSSSKLVYQSGVMNSLTQWELNLAPKRTGKLFIPSFSFKGAFSNAIEINVTEKGKLPPGQLRDVFFESEVDKERPFVQEQVVLTLRLASAVKLANYNFEPLSIPGAVQVKLAEHQYQKRMQGRDYSVIELKFAIFPQNSGELEIPAMHFTALQRSYSDPFGFNPLQGGTSKMVRVASTSRTLDVQPKPTTYSGDTWLPAENMQLDLRWSQAPSDFRVGEAITRTITITSTGLASSLLPPLDQATPPNMKTYAENPQMNDSVGPQGIKGTRIETLAMVPTQAGELTLPPVRLTWFDTQEQKEKVAEIPGQTVSVRPAAATAASPVPSLEPTQSTAPQTVIREVPAASLIYWQISTAAGFALAFLFFGLWMSGPRRGPSKSIDKPSPAADAGQGKELNYFKSLLRSCHEHHAAQAQPALLAWGRQFFPQRDITQLHSLVEIIDDPRFAEAISELQAVLYRGGEMQWNGEKLGQILVLLRKSLLKGRESKKRELPGFYPDQAA